jgi:hypothetical protein
MSKFAKMLIVVQIRQKGSTVGTLGFISIISTYISDQQRKLHYEGGIYQQKLYFVLKIFMDEGSHAKC